MLNYKFETEYDEKHTIEHNNHNHIPTNKKDIKPYDFFMSDNYDTESKKFKSGKLHSYPDLKVKQNYEENKIKRKKKVSNGSMSEYFLSSKISPLNSSNVSFKNIFKTENKKKEGVKKEEVSKHDENNLPRFRNKEINKVMIGGIKRVNKSVDKSWKIKLPKITNLSIDNQNQNETITMKNLKMFREIQMMHRRLKSKIF